MGRGRTLELNDDGSQIGSEDQTKKNNKSVYYTDSVDTEIKLVSSEKQVRDRKGRRQRSKHAAKLFPLLDRP
jgi:hypothetical protein